jgi:hypothetical protein
MQIESDDMVKKAIKEKNLIFVSAQPDSTYFHWQVDIYMYQFSKHGILDQMHCLFGYLVKPTDRVLEIQKRYPRNVHLYKDTRNKPTYAPSIRPHLLAKFFHDYPQYGKNVFYHDSDILLVKLPRFDLMLRDDVAYLSDTISYIGYDYIWECSKRYKKKYPQLPDGDIFFKMCSIVGTHPDIIKTNQNNSGGAQYLLKNVDENFWSECEGKCEELYKFFNNYESKYKIDSPIQKWTVDMWVLLWTYWNRGNRTLVHSELDFSWATDNVDFYQNKNIFHLAGIVGSNNSDKFHKGKYSQVDVFDAYGRNPGIFDHVNPNNATSKYVDLIKEYYSGVWLPEKLASGKITPDKVINGKISTNSRDLITGTNIGENVKKDIKPEKQMIKPHVEMRNRHLEMQSKKPPPRRLIGSVEPPSQFKRTEIPIQSADNNIVNNSPKFTDADDGTIKFERRTGGDNESIIKFKMTGGHSWADFYHKQNFTICGKNTWLSQNGSYIIFYNGTIWVLTYAKFMNSLGMGSGGLVSNCAKYPFENNWNCSVGILI